MSELDERTTEYHFAVIVIYNRCDLITERRRPHSNVSMAFATDTVFIVLVFIVPIMQRFRGFQLNDTRQTICKYEH